MSFFLSISIKRAIYKNGSPGTLYLTKAPSTGVISPVNENNRTTKNKQNRIIRQFKLDFLGNKNTNTINM